ncbi:MAG: hypothetical protein WA208_14940 [Thermoanaerobaculia bacterium]
MISPYAEVVRVIGETAPVDAADVRRWIDSGDLLTLSGVVALLDEQIARIDPPLADSDIVDIQLRYLLRCIEENPMPGDLLHGGFEAAWELGSRLRAWRTLPEGEAVVRTASVELERIFRRADDAARNRVLCGVLEHALEEPKLRPLFANWKRDEELSEALRLAIEWGKAHEGSG